MKEFGIYKVTKEYLDKFKIVENKLEELKIPKRPFVCVKIGGKNWLIPLSSLNPNDPNYNQRLHKQKDYAFHDNQYPPKCMDIGGDLAKTEIKGYKSVLLYYDAIPMKHGYCQKYRGKDGEHFVIDKNVGNKIRGRLINYLKHVKEGKLTGFIKYYVEKEGRDNYKRYSINWQNILKALYEDHYKKVHRDKLQKQSHQENRQIK